MTALLFGAAAAAYLGCAIFYFRGHFGFAGTLAVIYVGLIGSVAVRVMSSFAAACSLGLLAFVPVTYLVVHVVDARRGLFLLPTIYSIPIAFVAGLALWVITGVALVL